MGMVMMPVDGDLDGRDPAPPDPAGDGAPERAAPVVRGVRDGHVRHRPDLSASSSTRSNLVQDVTADERGGRPGPDGDPDGDAGARACPRRRAYTNGLNVLMRQVTQTAKVQSFDDCFFIATMIALFGLLPALLLKRGHRPAPPKPEASLEAEAALAD